MSKQSDGGKAFWHTLSDEAFAKTEAEFPVSEAKTTRTNRDGKVVNMDREAMLSRLENFRQGFVKAAGDAS